MYSSSFRNGTEAEGVGGALNGGHGAHEGWRGEERRGAAIPQSQQPGILSQPSSTAPSIHGCGGDSHLGDVSKVRTWHLTPGEVSGNTRISDSFPPSVTSPQGKCP